MKLKNTAAALAATLLLYGCGAAEESPMGSVASEEVASEVMETEVIEAVVADTANEEVNSGFIPATFSAPILIEGEGFKIVPLGPNLVEVDFEAYMSSIEHLQKTFTRNTNWPHANISAADAMLDMETEQARFESRESFAYAVLTPDGKRERGCVYVYPSTIEGYDAVVRMWVTKAEYDAGFDAQLYEWVTQWVATDWPFDKVAYPGRAVEWATWDGLVAETQAKTQQNLETAEGFIDAFYTFDPQQLAPFIADAKDSAPRISYYQGWAEGGNYIVVERGACESESATLFKCPVTVQDDPVVALKTGFNVTDTFHISFQDGKITEIKTSSNDQPIYYEARKWVEANMPEVMAGPCLDRNKGGKTPGDCARAMTEGYKQFYAATREGVESL